MWRRKKVGSRNILDVGSTVTYAPARTRRAGLEILCDNAVRQKPPGAAMTSNLKYYLNQADC
jgi:hypothetical protein